jgi:hypothetical protein
MEGAINKYTPQNVRDAWAKRSDNPFKGNEPISLSVRQLTECTDSSWLATIKDKTNQDHYDELKIKYRLWGCKGGSWDGSWKHLFKCPDIKINYENLPCEGSLLSEWGLGTSYDMANTDSDDDKIRACRKGFIRLGVNHIKRFMPSSH